MTYNKKMMRDISLNDDVSVTLPAHVWIGFISAYGATRWNCDDASAIGMEAINQLFDPVYVKEREAATQEEHDRHVAAIQTIVTGRPPEMPPNVTDDT